MRAFPPWLALVLIVSLGCSGDTAKGGKGKGNGEAKAPPSDALKDSPAEKEHAAGDSSVRPLENVHGQVKQEPAQKKFTRKIIYNATLSLVVDDLNKAEEALLELIDKEKVIIGKSAITGSAGSRRQGRWTLRVPVDRMRAFLRSVIKLGIPETNATDSEDVTGRYYDLEAVLKNHKADEESLRKQLAQASKEESARVLRHELRELRGEIEKLEGEYKRLADLTALSTVTLTFREVKNYVPPEAPPEPPPSFGSTVRQTFADSFEALATFGKWCALIVVAVVPWLPLAAVVVVPAGVAVRRRLKRYRDRLPILEGVSPEEGTAPGSPL
jgi:hypothetical protein